MDQNDPERWCPVSKEGIEIYLQILKPVYLLSISFLDSKNSIGNVFPSSLLLFLWAFGFNSILYFINIVYDD